MAMSQDRPPGMPSREHPDFEPKPASALLGDASKERLEEMLAFARAYRGWTQRELAAFLDRDVHNLVPKSGVPKADLLVRLGHALDWPAGMVLSELCGESAAWSKSIRNVDQDLDYPALNRAAFEAFGAGDFERMIGLGLRMGGQARSPEQRAEACLREFGGWFGLGRYEQAVDALQRGMRETDAPAPLRLRLRSNLANAYHDMGRQVEGHALADGVLRSLARAAVDARESLWLAAGATHVRGHCARHLALVDNLEGAALAVEAEADLREAEARWTECAAQPGASAYSANAFMCKVGRVANDPIRLGCPVDGALEILAGLLEDVRDTQKCPPGLWAEAYGWVCEFGAQLVARVRPWDAESDRLLAIFSNKGYELAEVSRNWALRVRMLAVDYVRLTRARGEHVNPSACVLDSEDLSLLAGAMARFPSFRPHGWELVRHAVNR